MPVEERSDFILKYFPSTFPDFCVFMTTRQQNHAANPPADFNYSDHVTVFDLPLLYIIKCLSLTDLLNLAQVSKAARDLAHEEAIWIHFARERFPQASLSKECIAAYDGSVRVSD